MQFSLSCITPWPTEHISLLFAVARNSQFEKLNRKKATTTINYRQSDIITFIINAFLNV